MILRAIDDLRIQRFKPLISPAIVSEEFPRSKAMDQCIATTRTEVSRIFHGLDSRLLVVVGPCSIHDSKAALEYGEKLLDQAQRYADELVIVMRVYFEKPRTTVGWKGYINDPDLDESFNVNKGLRLARSLLCELNAMGLPCATEFLDTMVPQYVADLISWAAICARTTESQIHRELASGLSMPIGFKNPTSGDISISIDSVQSAWEAHCFLGLTEHGVPAIVHTTGNQDAHIVLRGSSSGPNYDEQTVASAIGELKKRNLPPYLMIDCSHRNSDKDYRKQRVVVDSIASRLEKREKNIVGVMIESHLVEGRQNEPTVYGQSVTDACIGWKETTALFETLSKAVQKRRGKV